MNNWLRAAGYLMDERKNGCAKIHVRKIGQERQIEKEREREKENFTERRRYFLSTDENAPCHSFVNAFRPKYVTATKRCHSCSLRGPATMRFTRT